MSFHAILSIFVFILLLLLIYVYFDQIPSVYEHRNRNQHNIFPVGKLTHYRDNKYIDAAGIVWAKRGFFKRLLHNPFMYYVFESYDPKKQYSFEVQTLKHDFDKGIQRFTLGTFNFYSSITHPLSHLMADVLPIVIYLAVPKI